MGKEAVGCSQASGRDTIVEEASGCEGIAKLVGAAADARNASYPSDLPCIEDATSLGWPSMLGASVTGMLGGGRFDGQNLQNVHLSVCTPFLSFFLRGSRAWSSWTDPEANSGRAQFSGSLAK
jgi:hypothetical protein